jgi:hypothetical protein
MTVSVLTTKPLLSLLFRPFGSLVPKNSDNTMAKRYQRVNRIHISKKNRQHNGQMKKYKRTNNDLQNIHIKLKIE